MNIENYQKEAHKLAEYGGNPLYPVLGLCGEAGEVAEKVKKNIRKHDGKLQVTEEFRHKLKGELSDVCWYLAEISTVFDLKLEEIFEYNLEKLLDRKDRNVIKGEGDER